MKNLRDNKQFNHYWDGRTALVKINIMYFEEWKKVHSKMEKLGRSPYLFTGYISPIKGRIWDYNNR